MEQSKHFLKSKTIQGNLINLLSIFIVYITVHNPQDKTVLMSAFISALLGNIYSIYGRFVAKEKLTVKRKKNVQKSS
jgi:hypothetical protein